VAPPSSAALALESGNGAKEKLAVETAPEGGSAAAKSADADSQSPTEAPTRSNGVGGNRAGRFAGRRLIAPNSFGAAARLARDWAVDHWPLLALLGLTIVALAVRLYGLDWDANTHQHPDERAIISTVVNFGWPKTWTQFFSINSPLSPHFGDGSHFFAYGTFPMYVLWLVGLFLDWLQKLLGAHWIPAGQGSFSDYDHIVLVGRALSAVFDTGTALLCYPLGRRLSGSRVVGLLAMAFVAVTPFEVQLSHYFAVDTALVFFTTLALLSYVAVAQDGGIGWVLLAGVATGLAVASKFSALPLLLPLVIAYLLHWKRSEWQLALPRLFITLSAGLISFILAMPYALIDFHEFQAAIVEQGSLAQGTLDYPYTRQYAGTTPYVYELKNILLYDMGVPLALLCFAGLLLVVWRLWRSWQSDDLIPLSWVLVYFAITGSFYTKFSRYMLPIFPLLCIFGAALVVALWCWGARAVKTAPPPPAPAVETAPKGLRPPNPPTRVPPVPGGRTGTPGGRWESAKADLVAAKPPLGAVLTAGFSWLSRHARWLAAGVAVLVLGSSLLFTLALDNIYSQPLTRVQASRWLYQHLPSGNGLPIKTITYEIWDDSLPLDVDGQIASYHFIGLPLYDDDSLTNQLPCDATMPNQTNKIDCLAQSLAKADAVVIASNKLYPDSIPRLPDRYPVSNRYYQLLFNGGLGYHLAAVFQNSPNLFGIHFDDSGADESFSVYDHPTVHIFLPDSNRLSASEIEARLLDGVTLPGTDLTGTQKSLMLTPTQINDNQSMPPLAEQFPADSLANQHPLIIWWLVLELLGLAIFPIVAFLFRNFRDRGWAFAKTVSLLTVGYLVWLGASLRVVPYTRTTTLAVLLVVALGGLAMGVATRRDLLAFLRQHWGLLLSTEIVFTSAFLFFVLIRAADPDLWHIWRGGEKPMELAFLNGIVRSRYFPPLDSWFAGGFINYYYYGQFLISILIRLTAIVPTTAFNLAIPTLFALLLTGGFSIVSHLTRRWWAGLIGGVFVALMGNLDGFHQLLANLQRAVPQPFDYWASSRVIPFTINEFPYWSFLYADLHAHVIDLPLEVLTLGMAATILSGRREKRPPLILTIGRVLLLGLTLGAMACINTWEVPTYAVIILLALVLREYTLQRRGWLLSYAAVKRVVLQMVGIAAGAYLFYLPFYTHFQTFVSGTGTVKTPDKLAEYITLFGLWLFVVVSFYFVELYQWVAEHLTRRLAAAGDTDAAHPAYSALFWGMLLLYGIALCFLYFSLNKLMQVLYSLLIVGLILFLVRGRGQRAGKQFTYLLLLSALGISIVVETIYVRDFLDNGDFERMNTVFKFFEQVWVFYALGSALAVFEMVRWAWRARVRARDLEQGGLALALASQEAVASVGLVGGAPAEPDPDVEPEPRGQSAWGRAFLRFLRATFLVRGRTLFPGLVRWAWSFGLVFLLLACSVFLVEGTQARIADHTIWAEVSPPVNSPNYLPTLDGMAYMDAWYPGDYAAIEWLNANVSGSPVILEGSCGGYQWCGRVAEYTGLPSVLGWDSHESQQRYPDGVYTRLQDVRTIYQTGDPSQALALLHKYNVRYVYLGQCERMGNKIPYCGGDPPLSPDALAKFTAMVGTSLRVAYQNQYVTIYQVVG
jgi:YYY domain-containing protein